MRAGPNIVQCFVYVGFLQLLLSQDFSHAVTSFGSLRKERKHLDQRQRVQRLTTGGKYPSYSNSVATRTPLILHSFPQKKLTHMFTKLSVLSIAIPDPFIAIRLSGLFHVSWSCLSGCEDDVQFSER